MKNFSLKNTLAGILLPTLVCLAYASYAQTESAPLIPSGPAIPNNGGSNNSSGGSTGNINIVGGYSSNYWTAPKGADSATIPFYLITPSPSFNDSIVINLFFANYLASLSTTALSPTTPTVTALNNLLTSTSSNASLALNAAMAQYFPLPVTPTSSNAPPPQNTLYNFFKGQVGTSSVTANSPYSTSSSAPTSSVNSLNLAALIDPIQYGTTQFNASNNAKNFIMYLSNQYNPTPLIDFTTIAATPGSLLQALGMAPVQQYLYTVREMAANYSVGMSDLYYLYNQRVPQPTSALIGTQFQSITQSTLPANLQKTASPLALEQWMATHRLTSYDPNNSTPQWLTAMENATPATLQRENLYLLAEIRDEMFQERMLQQHILATLAAQQMQNINSQQIQLQQLQAAICSDSLFKNSNACPQATQSAGTAAATAN